MVQDRLVSTGAKVMGSCQKGGRMDAPLNGDPIELLELQVKQLAVLHLTIYKQISHSLVALNAQLTHQL